MKADNICRLCGAISTDFVGIFANNNKNELSSVGEMILDLLFTEVCL